MKSSVNLPVVTSNGRQSLDNNTMHTERRSPCVLKWRITCRRPVIVDVMLPDHSSFGTSNARSNERVLNQLETHRGLQKRLLAIRMRGRHSVFLVSPKLDLLGR